MEHAVNINIYITFIRTHKHAFFACAGEVYIDADSNHTSASATSQIAHRTMDALQGFKVMGTQKVEKALPVGTDLTVIGEVVSTKTVGQFPV